MTESPPIWTPETLKALMDERDRRYAEVSAAKELAVRTAMEASEKAIRKEEENSEKWRVNANEWRAAMNDRERNFLSKSMGLVLATVSVVALLLTIADRFK